MTKSERGKLCSVVIPNWNGIDYLKICLPSLKKQTYQNLEIIIIDNGSTDQSIQYITKNYKDILLIKLDKNYGFVKAVNLGIKKAQGEYLLLLNNDTEVDKDCIQRLVKVAQSNSQVGFVAPKLLNFYNRHQIDSAGDMINIVGHANSIGGGQKDSKKYSKASSVFLATAGGSLFKKQLFDEVGLLDEDYFIYFEDVDLCLRAQLKGFSGWYEPSAKVYHVNKGTMSKRSKQAEYLRFRNMTMTLLKNFPTKVLMLNLPKIVMVNLRTAKNMAMNGYFKEAVLAETYLIWHLPAIFRKRVVIQSQRTVSDEYFKSNLKPYED